MSDNTRLPVGSTWQVGSFFWVDERSCFGFSKDAKHGHGLLFGGSVNVGDAVRILGHERDGMVAVKVLKQQVPFGAPCPHGMLFLMPESQIRGWTAAVDREAAAQMERAALAHKYKDFIE